MQGWIEDAYQAVGVEFHGPVKEVYVSVVGSVEEVRALAFGVAFRWEAHALLQLQLFPGKQTIVIVMCGVGLGITPTLLKKERNK